MTKLTGDAVVRRETTSVHRGRELCLEVHGRYIKIWPKGTKTQSTNVDIETIYERGLMADAKRVA